MQNPEIALQNQKKFIAKLLCDDNSDAAKFSKTQASCLIGWSNDGTISDGAIERWGTSVTTMVGLIILWKWEIWEGWGEDSLKLKDGEKQPLHIMNDSKKLPEKLLEYCGQISINVW